MLYGALCRLVSTTVCVDCVKNDGDRLETTSDSRAYGVYRVLN